MLNLVEEKSASEDVIVSKLEAVKLSNVKFELIYTSCSN